METTVRSVDRALLLLTLFEEGGEKLTLKVLSDGSGLPKPTVARLLTTLEKWGYVRRSGLGQFSLGPTPFRLGRLYQRSLRLADLVIPSLSRLAERANETATFYVRSGSDRICLHVAECQNTMREQQREGEVRPLNESRTGRLLRAFSGEQFEGSDELRSDVLLFNKGRRHPDLVSITCPVFRDGEDLAGAIALSGLQSHFDGEHSAKMIAHLLEEAIALTISFGGNPIRLIAAQSRQPRARHTGKTEQVEWSVDEQLN